MLGIITSRGLKRAAIAGGVLAATVTGVAGNAAQSIDKAIEGVPVVSAVSTPSPLTTATATATAKAIAETLTAEPAAAAEPELFRQAVPETIPGLTAKQTHNAAQIVTAGRKMGMPSQAIVIALATGLTESNLNNYGWLGAANDHDSIGVFQQRASWASYDTRHDVYLSAKLFYSALNRVSGWWRMALGDAAQAVQISAFPDRYQERVGHAQQIFDNLKWSCW